MKAKYFEDCLKASSEFDIPLVVIDKTYYFNKMLANSVIYDEATILLNNKNEYDKMSKASNPYGDGNTSKYIVDAIIGRYGNK